MGRLFDGPWPIVIIIIVALLLFAAPKLPQMARSLGQSMRIMKSEVKQMKDESPSKAKAEEPVEGKVVQHPEAATKDNGEQTPPSGNA
ncbi:sec-independent protein translocase protein TatA [Arthrobacter woluwensis]|uniref:Sec-independent protein translocase subunit TatA n=1 Tax=Arthrobacter woluwensis TaxID=156980 RepID=UPI00277FCB2F|nr:Sec-independent protein translocase subunit TatA [Arthrobacter woluwensis]MDQ0708767.1 sec-independent protein translocase protein TatA [Arthrobacter woluwensis]